MVGGGEKNIPQLNPGQLSEISDDNNWILEGLTTSPFLQLFFTFLSGKVAKRGCESWADGQGLRDTERRFSKCGP